MSSSAILQADAVRKAPVIKARRGGDFWERDHPRTMRGTGALVLHQIFEAQADARPDAVAVMFGREKASYAELERRTNRLARHLHNRGVRGGARVAMLLPRSVEAFVALLGIL